MNPNKFLSLVFSFYLTEDFETNIANKMHFFLLEKYHNLFSQSLFVIIIDDVNNIELIKKFEQKIISCGFVSDVNFKITENTYYHEAYVFKKYLVDNFKQYEGLVFFAHNKGITNVKNKDYDSDIILLWIYILYTLSLNYLDEAFGTCIELSSQSLFFGALYNIGFTIYSGAIYLMCPGNIIKYLRIFNLTTDDLKLDNRWFAEDFPNKVIQNKEEACHPCANKCASHYLRRHFSFSPDVFYGKDITKLKNIFNFLDSENYDLLINEFNNICNKIKSN